MIYPTYSPRTEARLEQIAEEIASLRCFIQQEFTRMSQTLEQQLEAGVTAVQADIATIAASLTTIAVEITQLQAQLQPGATISPADIDSINALKAQADAAVATAKAMATPPAPAPAGP